MKKSKIITGVLFSTVGLLVASCGGSTVKNAEKPLVFFNRQPSDPTTGVIDMDTMNFSDKTYYVGFDAAGGGAVQGKMITDYIQENGSTIDKNNDGTIGYVLAIGDAGHNDSRARTRGIREALGTWKDSYGATSNDVKEGKITVGDKEFKVVELVAKEMKSDGGSTWDATTAGNSIGGWVNQFGNQIDLVISNNDGMAMGMLSNASYPKGTPVFGYDANADALDSIKNGDGLTGTVSQNVDAQAAGTLQVIRNMLDGLTGKDVITKGITEADQYGNKISAEMKYDEATKSLLALNTAVTAKNVAEFAGKRDAGIKQTTAETKKVLLTLYSASDNFLSSSYRPALEYYSKLMNLELNIQAGDGSSETSVLDKFINLSNYDAYAVNMVKTNSGADYLNKLS